GWLPITRSRVRGCGRSNAERHADHRIGTNFLDARRGPQRPRHAVALTLPEPDASVLSLVFFDNDPERGALMARRGASSLHPSSVPSGEEVMRMRRSSGIVLLPAWV